MEETRLKPCPFCGGEVKATTNYRAIEAGAMGQGTTAGYVSNQAILCRKCGTFNLEIERWNRRAPLKE